jgi:hypothetical protein
VVDQSRTDSMRDKVSARPLVTRLIDSIRSCAASTVSSKPLAPMIMDPTKKELVGLEKGIGAQKIDHLVRQGFSAHTPYLPHHCRRSMVDNLPRGMSMVVDESVEVRERRTRGDTERDVGSSGHRHDVTPYVLCLCGLYCL